MCKTTKFTHVVHVKAIIVHRPMERRGSEAEHQPQLKGIDGCFFCRNLALAGLKITRFISFKLITFCSGSLGLGLDLSIDIDVQMIECARKWLWSTKHSQNHSNWIVFVTIAQQVCQPAISFTYIRHRHPHSQPKNYIDFHLIRTLFLYSKTFSVVLLLLFEKLYKRTENTHKLER